MVKKRNRRTRKKYIKRGGASDTELAACNTRLKEQGIGLVKRRNMCIESDGKAGLKKEEETKKPSIKDRASALEEQFGDRTKGRKALRTTVGSCRAALDDGNKYYYNEAGETTDSPPGTEEFDKVCNPTEGIVKTGRSVGECKEAIYKNGKPYLYTKEFSTHNMNDPRCFPDKVLKTKLVPSKLFKGVDGIKILKNEEKKIEEEKKSQVECSKLSNTKCKKSDNCDLVIERIKGNTNNKKNKIKKCLPKTVGGKRTKRKKSRKKRKKSRKRRR